MNTLLAGKCGEAKAAEYLRKQRWDVIAAGYHCRFGEIDLIAVKKDMVIFVEVKLRKDSSFAAAYEAVTYAKQRRIIATALFWMKAHNCDKQMRFDVIEIYSDTRKLNHIENAFQA